MVDAKLGHTLNDLSLQLRTRFRQDIFTYIESAGDEEPENQIRTRLKAEYDIPSCKITPYIAGELFFPLGDDDGYKTETFRFICGADLKINGKQSITVEYFNEQNLLSDKRQNIVSLEYALEF